MNGQYIIVKSITYANKAVTILNKKNISASIERAPSSLSSCGCCYAVKLRNNANTEFAVKILEDSKIKVLSYGVA